MLLWIEHRILENRNIHCKKNQNTMLHGHPNEPKSKEFTAYSSKIMCVFNTNVLVFRINYPIVPATSYNIFLSWICIDL